MHAIRTTTTAPLPIILLAYSREIIGSRKIEAACRENILFIAVSQV